MMRERLLHGRRRGGVARSLVCGVAWRGVKRRVELWGWCGWFNDRIGWVVSGCNKIVVGYGGSSGLEWSLGQDGSVRSGLRHDITTYKYEVKPMQSDASIEVGYEKRYRTSPQELV